MAEASDEGSRRLRTFGERTVYDRPEVHVGVVDVGLPGGERVWRHVVHMHRSASVVLIDAQDRVLLLWRHRFAQDRWGWELPGGPVDADEEPGEAAVRELEEQAGYRVGELAPLVSFEPFPDAVVGERVVFSGKNLRRTGDAIRSDGIDRSEWVPLSSVPELIDGGQVWDSATLIGLLKVLRQGT